MNVNDQYRINAPNVVSETIDDEVIIIHLEAGIYYSMQGTGATIWNLIERGATVRQIAESLLTSYDGDLMTISFAIAPFITQLIDQGLIVAMTGGTPLTLALTPPAVRPPFVTPMIDIYKDMQNLLMIDPIHEVGDIGWPQQNPAS
ncbi:MAG: PqqD family protein [Chloroflexota bacterium]|mgnify:CR=1 FL=1|nr:PqqD family protein [Chloroflexota bacterium]